MTRSTGTHLNFRNQRARRHYFRNANTEIPYGDLASDARNVDWL
jgi:hypothetical protein